MTNCCNLILTPLILDMYKFPNLFRTVLLGNYFPITPLIFFRIPICYKNLQTQSLDIPVVHEKLVFRLKTRNHSRFPHLLVSASSDLIYLYHHRRYFLLWHLLPRKARSPMNNKTIFARRHRKGRPNVLKCVCATLYNSSETSHIAHNIAQTTLGINIAPRIATPSKSKVGYNLAVGSFFYI